MSHQLKTFYGIYQNSHNEFVANQFAVNVQKSYDLYLFGKSLRDIGKCLKEASVPLPTGKPDWMSKAIENILSNTTYITIAISKDTFSRVRAKQTRRSNTATTEHGTARKPTRYNSKNVLSSLFVCQECGKQEDRRITKHDGAVIWRCTNHIY